MADRTVRADRPTLVGGRYRLRGEVGRGGMAVVYRAHDEVLDREVAVKLLHAHLASDPAFLDRFRREAQAAAALSDPSVVAVHDWGETPDGPYLVLQLVEGATLRDVLRARGRLTAGEALAVLGPVAQGLAAAHRGGLVHRDVKPENLLLGTDGSARVADFGLARAAASATTTFGADVLVGSPHYLSPEAVRGLPLDPRADVYALGIILYECLVGRPPHEGDSPLATAVAHTARAVPPPSDAVPDVPAELDEIVTRATMLDRDRRFPDGAAFARALANAVPDGPQRLVLPSPVGTVFGTGETTILDAARRPGDADHARRQDPADGDDLDGDTAVVPLADTATDHLRPHRSGRRGWLAALVVVLLLAASAAGGYLLWDRVLAPVTPVPQVVAVELDRAQEDLRQAGFEVLVAAEEPFDLAVGAGHVLAQHPDDVARLGSVVTLTVSAGPQPVAVPEVAGDDERTAVTRLRQAGLEPQVVQRHDEEVAAGQVLGTDPPATTVVGEASTVAVVVSLGPTPVEVPDLRGASQDAAAATLEERGLEVGSVARRHDAQAPAGQVLDQSPTPDTTLTRGDAVDLVVSIGPPPVEVPPVRGMPTDEAVAALRGLGLEVDVQLRGGIGALLSPGRVYDQSPAPGTSLAHGGSVVLYAYE